jgi:UvrD/REP helicase N-terminal domain/UvrD-like helicase C-terminal domain
MSLMATTALTAANRTPEQSAIREAISKGESLAANAVAGSAKTTTLVDSIDAVPHPTGIYVCFNKANADELKEKIKRPGYEAKTMNGLGHGIWGKKLGKRLTLNVSKTRDNVRTWLTENRVKLESNVFIDICKTIGLGKTSGISSGILGQAAPDLTRWRAVMDEREIDPSLMDDYGDLIIKQLQLSVKQAWDGMIDFDDQLYMPVMFKAIFPTYPFAAVDEAQDLSPLQHEMFARIKAEQRVVVGDPKQAIYAFRGASSSSFDELIEKFGLPQFSLSFSFRCPKAVEPYAQVFVPHFKSFHKNAEGSVEEVTTPDIGVNNTIIGRFNAPLLRLAFEALRNSTPINYLGRDFLAGLKALHKKHPSVSELESWARIKIAEAKTDGAKQRVMDQYSSLVTLHKTGGDVGIILDTLSEGSKRGNVLTLSTIHKIKGMEAPRVTYLEAKTLDEHEGQEGNLSYVALTRTTNHLMIHRKPR